MKIISFFSCKSHDVIVGNNWNLKKKHYKYEEPNFVNWMKCASKEFLWWCCRTNLTQREHHTENIFGIALAQKLIEKRLHSNMRLTLDRIGKTEISKIINFNCQWNGHKSLA